MATHKDICHLTNKEETIWFNMIDTTTNNGTSATVGLMLGCSVDNNISCECKECNIYKELEEAIRGR